MWIHKQFKDIPAYDGYAQQWHEYHGYECYIACYVYRTKV